MSVRHVIFPSSAAPAIRISERLPSRQPVDLYEVLIDEVNGETWLRFRFLAPELGTEDGALSFEKAQADFQFLCGNVALPYMTENDLRAEVVAISMLERPVPFGQSDQGTLQLVEAFRVDTGTCMWEGLW